MGLVMRGCIILLVEAGEHQRLPSLMSDRWLADVTLFGTAHEVREGVEAWFEAGVRTLTVRVRSPRGARWMRLVPDPSMATIEAMGVRGALEEIDPAAGPVVLTLLGVPAEGVEVAFRLLGRQPLALGVMDVSYGLPSAEGAPLAPRPSHLIRSPRWLSDTTSVYGLVWF